MFQPKLGDYVLLVTNWWKGVHHPESLTIVSQRYGTTECKQPANEKPVVDKLSGSSEFLRGPYILTLRSKASRTTIAQHGIAQGTDSRRPEPSAIVQSTTLWQQQQDPIISTAQRFQFDESTINDQRNPALQTQLNLKDQVIYMQSQNQSLENGIQKIQSELEHRTRILEARVQEAKSEKEEVKAEYDSFIRQKQEERFEEMGSWHCVEGSKVIGDLDRLRRNMRAFGKEMSANDLSVFQRLEEASHVALMNNLSDVCVLRNEGLPEGLTSSKSPALLLNALLALFKNPFFFLEIGLGDVSPKLGLDRLLSEIYSRMQQGKSIQDFRI
jgi:hypothetical protein